VIKERSISDLAQTFNEEFGRWLKPGPMLEKLSRLTRLTGEIWQYFDECIQLDGARIFEYDASNDLDEFGSCGITGDFAFVIIQEGQQRCLFLSAGDCD